MLERGFDGEMRDVKRDPLSLAELDALVGERDIGEYVNFRNARARELGWKASPPGRDEALAEMAAECNLHRRPILVVADEHLVGWDEAEAFRILGL